MSAVSPGGPVSVGVLRLDHPARSHLNSAASVLDAAEKNIQTGNNPEWNAWAHRTLQPLINDLNNASDQYNRNTIPMATLISRMRQISASIQIQRSLCGLSALLGRCDMVSSSGALGDAMHSLDL